MRALGVIEGFARGRSRRSGTVSLSQNFAGAVDGGTGGVELCHSVKILRVPSMDEQAEWNSGTLSTFCGCRRWGRPTGGGIWSTKAANRFARAKGTKRASGLSLCAGSRAFRGPVLQRTGRRFAGQDLWQQSSTWVATRRRMPVCPARVATSRPKPPDLAIRREHTGVGRCHDKNCRDLLACQAGPHGNDDDTEPQGGGRRDP